MKKRIIAFICVFMMFTQQVNASVLGIDILGWSLDIASGTKIFKNTFMSDKDGIGQQAEYYAEYVPNEDVVPIIVSGEEMWGVDKIHEAITFDKQISFRYFDYSITKDKLYRREGARYMVSPYALTWDDENYYLIAHEEESGLVKHYRVDKMSDIETEKLSRNKSEDFDGSKLAEYAGKVFGMFAGEERKVRLRFVNHLASAVIDRFGRDVIINSKDDGSFTVTVSVVVSPQFYGWLCGFGDEVQLLWPEDVRDDFVSYVKKLMDKY